MKMTRCASSHHWEGISSRPPRNTPKKLEDPTGSRTSYRKQRGITLSTLQVEWPSRFNDISVSSFTLVKDTMIQQVVF